MLAASLIAVTKSSNEGTTQREIFFWLIVYVESVYDNTVKCVPYVIVAVVRQLVKLPVQSGSREN